MPKQFQPQSFAYTVCAKIGEGLHSEVYKVIKLDTKHNLSQIMALKILKSKTLADIWKNEFQNLSKISSNYCVRILGWEWISARPALVLEYIEGTCLQNLLDIKNLSLSEINFICTQLYWGIKDLKKFGVSHGDLNPRNILFTLQGDLKLIDFGIQGDDLEVLYASPQFCAPELFYEKIPSYESDLYSLGILRKLLLQSSNIPMPDKELNFFKSLIDQKIQNRSLIFLDPEQSLNLWSHNKMQKNSLCQKILSIFLQQQKIQEKTKKIKPLNLFFDPNKKYSIFSVSLKSFFNKHFLDFCKNALLQLQLGRVVLILLLGFALKSTAKTFLEQTNQIMHYTELSVITKDWKKIFIDEVFISYSPVYFLYLKHGKHSIKWTSSHTQLQRKIFISGSKKILLNDSFFKK